ncbi:MAG: radical SAM protein [Treponemataceae bacterium]|nr:radical SAM protein [Treponemataceae bacterium]
MFDRFGRSIEYLRISITDRCNLRCRYCMPQENPFFLPPESLLSREAILTIAEEAVSAGITKIRFTGGEPLLRQDLVDIIKALGRLPRLKILAITTNGTLLADQAASLKKAGLQRVNISLDTMDPGLFQWLTRGGNITTVFRGIQAAREVGLSIKINTVVLSPHLLCEGGFSNQNIEEIQAFASSIGAEHQCIAQYKLGESKEDSPYERPPPCENCNRLRLLATGFLKPCLHSDITIPIDMDNIEGSLRQAIEAKPYRGNRCRPQNINHIGG